MHYLLERNIRLHMLLRLIMLFSVLLTTTFSQVNLSVGRNFGTHTFNNGYFLLNRIYFITFFTFLVTTAFIFLSEKVKDARHFLSSQIAYDILFTTVLIYYTGTSESIYTFFYFFNIIFAAIIFRGSGALIASLASSILYAALIYFTSENITGERSFTLLTTITGFVAIALLSGQLIEEIRKGRQKISRLEELSEEIVESLDSGLIAIDSSLKVKKINRTAQKLLNIVSENESNISLAKILPENIFQQLNEVIDLNVAGVQKKILVNRVALPEGHSMILLKDLTDVLVLEEKLRRQERLAGVGRLAAGVAHEIRNPIASISGSAQLLIEEETTDERKRLMQIILRESDRVDRLVAQLLKFAKPTIVQRTDFDLSSLIEDTIESIKSRADYVGANIVLSSSVEKRLKIRGNRDELSEVLTNLLVNSLQAMSGKTGKIQVIARKIEKYIEIVVVDDGPGIPSEFRNRVFDPFFTTKSEGTGLGLAQVHKILKEHDGQIDLESEVGRGTSMRVRLPA